MHIISKEFHGSFGHRVWSQDVNSDYAGSDECPCRRLHGHNFCAVVTMETDSLDQRGFVIDYKELTFIKSLFDDHIDHRFMISRDDPLFERIVGHKFEDLALRPVMLKGIYAGSRIISNDEYLDSFFIVNINPTSEQITKWIYEILEKVFDNSPFVCMVKSVGWGETPKTMAVYSK